MDLDYQYCIYRQEYYYWIHRELSQKDVLVKVGFRLLTKFGEKALSILVRQFLYWEEDYRIISYI